MLTGKYNEGIPKGSRLTQKGYEWLQARLDQQRKDGVIDRVKRLTEFAGGLECSMTQLALAWCVKNPNVTTVLLGATRPEQLEENLGCLEVVERLTESHMVEIDEILGNRPEGYMGYGGRGMRQIETI